MSLQEEQSETTLTPSLALVSVSPSRLLFFFFCLFGVFLILLCVSECLPACLRTTCVPGACGVQKRALHPLELELQMVVRCYMQALGIEPRSSRRTVIALSC